MPKSTRSIFTQILRCLEKAIPIPNIELLHDNPFQLLVATILSAQCTDVRVNAVTPKLFSVYKTPSDFSKANPSDLETLIFSTGFYKNKAQSIIGAAQTILTHFKGEVPQTMAKLLTLPGVGRKTANVILGGVFGRPAIVVDTHVRRVANRLNLTASQNPDQIEMDLGELMPKSKWTAAGSRLLLHGRYVCLARNPICSSCVLFDLCPCDAEKRKSENRL
ncbi:MAG: endonuclease III [Nitrospirota bacterium]